MSHECLIRMVVLAILACAAITATAFAQQQEQIACSDINNWEGISDADIAERGLTEKVAATIAGTQAIVSGSFLGIEVIAKDCPKTEYPLLYKQIASATAMDGAETHHSMWYLLSLDVSILRWRTTEQLELIGQGIACGIRDFEMRKVQVHLPPQNVAIAQCMANAAHAAGQFELERWIRRTHRDTEPTAEHAGASKVPDAPAK